MISLQSIAGTAVASRAGRASAKHLYWSLLGEHGPEAGTIDEVTRSASWSFLRGCLDEARRIETDLPVDPRGLIAWAERQHESSAAAYRAYLDERRAGAPRRFFRTRSHALGFLRAVAPTKLVDGAWLYGLLPRASDRRIAPLIRTYLEELGDGAPAQNHVLVYRALLSANGCDEWQDHLDDDHYTQGAIQLALAHHADALLPEVIGFNLGYEQLPLHLPITAYELNELDIDPYYFTLHVTIDNASAGHARKALQAAIDCLPNVGDRRAFYRRVADGYRLNELGTGTTKAIAAFDLEQELVAVLTDKARVGAQLHSDYCRIAGRTITDWLADPSALPEMLAALVRTGWIRRGAAPEESRFWRVLHDERGPMFGVFDGYASQLLRDWIVDGADRDVRADAKPRSPNRFSGRTTASTGIEGTPVGRVVERELRALSDVDRHDDDMRALVERVSGLDQRDAVLAAVRGFLSPANHSSPAGLAATRIFAGVFAA